MTNTTDYSDLVGDDCRVLDDDHRSHDKLHLWINEGGQVVVGIRTYYGGDGTPVSEWLGRVRVFTLVGRGGAHIDLDALRDDLRPDGRLSPLIDRVVAGLDSEWDGSNMRGTLTDDAREAEDELESLIERIQENWIDSEWSTWAVGDWLDAVRHEITADMTDEQVAAWAAECEASAESERVRLVGDVAEWATKIRDDERADADEAA